MSPAITIRYGICNGYTWDDDLSFCDKCSHRACCQQPDSFKNQNIDKYESSSNADKRVETLKTGPSRCRMYVYD